MPNLLPAKRYDVFQSAFEKRMAAIQAEVAKMDSLQGVYTAAREALIAVDLSNDIKLELSQYGVEITVHVQDGDTMETFHRLLDEVGNALVQRRLHPDGLPAEHHWSTVDKQFTWNCVHDGINRPLYLTLSVPYEGTDHIEILQEKKAREGYDTHRRAVWHTRPWRSRTGGAGG